MVVGVTGAIGSGKSTVAKILADSGFSIICADKIGHSLLMEPSPAYQQLIDAFGTVILDQDRQISRDALGKLVFLDSEKLATLNRITHPLISAEIQHTVDSIKGNTVIDAALLYQCGLDKLCHKVIFVYADQGIRISRLIQRTGWSENEILRRMRSQADMDQYKVKADAVVLNNDGIIDLIEQVEILICQFLSQAEQDT